MKRIAELLLGSLLLCGGFLQGCASLDARPDYESVADLVGRSTGHHELAFPGSDKDLRAEIDRRLEGGLTADEAVAVSLLGSPRLQALILEVGISRADFAQASFLQNPSLALALRYPSGGGTPNVEASLIQNLAELWRLPMRREAAKASLKQVVFEIAREVSGLAYEAKASYVRALAADRMKAIAGDNREIAAQFLDVALERKKGGEGSGVDVSFARSEASAAEVALRTASLASFERRAELASRLGLLTPPGELVLADSLPPLEQVPPTIDAVLSGLADRPDLQAANRAVESAKATLHYERLGVLSLFGVGAAYESPERRSGEDRDSSEYIFGPSLSLQIPLFDQNRAQIAKAMLLRERAERLRDGLLIESTQQARAALERLITSLDVARLYQSEMIPVRESGLRLVREAYSAGELPVSSMLEAQRNFLEAKVQSVSVLEASALAWVELEKVTGRPAAKQTQTF